MDLEKLVESKILNTYKVCIIGCKQVGKTSLLLRFLNNSFTEKYFPTKKLTICETFQNFHFNSSEEDKNSCVELLDT